jgi:asparagine synthase (glutamine-hydrolysing)
MCGIFGVSGENIGTDIGHLTDAALATLSKRGPDDKGSLIFPHCVLAQTRLSIIDLTTGSQPMRDRTRDIAITFNGEIYNYRELKESLQKKGYVFSTTSDTEVILKAYQEYGKECPKYLNGMFAFAIWDNENKKLFIARDRFGKKPFYYAFDNEGNLFFASEIKAIFATGIIKGVIDYRAIDSYMHLLYIPPYETVYKNIFVLPAAHYGTFEHGKLNLSRYWTMPYKPITISEDDAIKRIRELLDRATESRMVADVEVGVFLSGGVDSSIIAYLAQKHSSKKLKSFSAGFQDYINELPYARKAADIIKTDHHELQMDVDLADTLKKVCAYFDEPFADSSSIPQFLIAEFAAKSVKVVLSGDGGDEMFLGYGWYWKQYITGGVERIRRLLKRTNIKHLFTFDALHDHVNYMAHINRFERYLLWKNKKYADSPIRQYFSGSKKLSPLGQINVFDHHMFLPGDNLTKVDRCSMMASLEVRSPFLDHELAEFVFNLPLEYKTDMLHGKLILKKAYRDIFGDKFLNRRKQGFSAPVLEWLKRDDFKKMIYNLFIDNDAEIYRFLNKWFIQKMIRRFYEKNDSYHCYRLWVILCLELWYSSHKQHFDL